MAKITFSRVRGVLDREIDVRRDGALIGTLYKEDGMDVWAGDAQLEESLGENAGAGDTLREAKADVRERAGVQPAAQVDPTAFLRRALRV